MISATEFRRGTKILHKDEPHVVLEFLHNKTGRGGALVRAKLRNLITGAQFEENFRSGEKFANPDLEHKEMQYLYVDNGLYNFMDKDTYEQITLDKSNLEEVLGYLKEQETYQMLYFKDRPIGVTAPLHMQLKVVDTPPGVKGDTAQGAGTKPAVLETGITIQVPLFVSEGDIIKVDTRTNDYIERM